MSGTTAVAVTAVTGPICPIIPTDSAGSWASSPKRSWPGSTVSRTVRAVARAHGGDATAAARPAGGLVVTVTLPAPSDP